MYSRTVSIMAIAIALSACASYGPEFSPDTERSGFLESEKITIELIGKQKTAIRPALDPNDIPQSITKLCGGASEEAGATATTLILSAFSIGYEYFLQSVDDRRARIKKAAVKQYSGQLLPPIGEFELVESDCIRVLRTVKNGENENAFASSYVFRLESKNIAEEGDPPSTLLRLDPIYATIQLAGAQTKAAEAGKESSVAPTVAVALSGYELDSRFNRPQGRTLTNSTFSFGPLALGQVYCKTPPFDGTFGQRDTCTKPLKTEPGEYFVPLNANGLKPTGRISVSVVERGSAADLDDLSAADKAARKTIGSTLSTLLKSAID